MNQNAFGTLQTGTYLISNVKTKNNVVIPDNTDKKAPLIARCEPSLASSKWNVTLHSNGTYTIVNYAFGNSASTSALSVAGEDIRALSTRVQKWLIAETGIRGNYLISHLDGEYCWGVDNGEEETPITLASVPNNKLNQWNFTRVNA